MQIRRLTFTRFRRFEQFVWHPQPGINCLVGPGDSGKTTVLEAIGRATSPGPPGPASEHDYWRRHTEDEFEMELVLGNLSKPLLGAYAVAPLWGWKGPGEDLLDAPVDDTEAVFVLVVRGTADLEVEHRLRSPKGDELNFSSAQRGLLGLCRIGEMRGSSREFRMARGSLLERVLGREDVRGATARAMREASRDLNLSENIKQGLADLGTRLQREGVTAETARLEVLSPPGQSLLGLLGLALGEPGEAVPLAYSGQGAQRLASFVLATSLTDAPALVVMDELEVGLEPYRQRLLVGRLRDLVEKSDGQAFLTTHSPTVLAELEIGELHRLYVAPATDIPPTNSGLAAVEGPVVAEASVRASTVPQARIQSLSSALKRTVREDPEVLLCRLPVVCEGQTELQLLRELLDALILTPGTTLAALGVRLVDGRGQPQAFDVIAGLLEADFRVGAFLDVENEHSGRRDRLEGDGRVALGSFRARCTEEALAQRLPEALLDELVDVGSEHVPGIGHGRRQHLNSELGQPGELSPSELASDKGWAAVRTALGSAAAKQGWFKQREAAHWLARWLADGRLPAPMRANLSAFWADLSRWAHLTAEAEPPDDRPEQ
jgi:putative ATP-dependent endonuclease of OLD family